MATSADLLLLTLPNDSNTKGIPITRFIENEEKFVAESNRSIDDIFKIMNELYRKYKFMEAQLVQQKKSLLQKIPDIKSALQAVRFLIKKRDNNNEESRAQFELSDNIFANAVIIPDDKVSLWLGANVMLEYSYDEALALLSKNVENAQKSLESLSADLSFLKDQITTSEVNIARMHNYNVKLRQKARESQGKASAN